MRTIQRTGFGQRLFDARTAANLTQKQLAKIAGISQSTLAELERHGHGSARTLQLAAACGVAALWLADETGSKYPTPATEHAATAGYSPEALALAWLLDQVPRRVDKVRANSAATAAILEYVHERAAVPTGTPVQSEIPAKPRA